MEVWRGCRTGCLDPCAGMGSTSKSTSGLRPPRALPDVVVCRGYWLVTSIRDEKVNSVEAMDIEEP